MGMITAHGYIDNPTFRGMRWHLRNTFDKIYILDLHGNSNKKETSPDGSKGGNIFDIKTGVAIILGIKKSNIEYKKLAQIYKADFYGIRKEKFKNLDISTIDNVDWVNLPENTDLWVLEGEGKNEYQKGFSVAELFPKNSTGIVTMGDSFIIDENKETLTKRIDEFLQNDISESELKKKYDLGKNYPKWIIDNKKKIENDHSKIVPLEYRPFDTRYTYFDNNLVWRPRIEVLRHFINRENVGLVTPRQSSYDWSHAFVCNKIAEFNLISTAAKNGSGNVFPIYLYTEKGEKVPNLNKEIWNKINDVAGETKPENILDYVYAVLHSPQYRETYKEFLKIDFPRVPYPTNKNEFGKLVNLGNKLRGLHLMTDPECEKIITKYSVAGGNFVERIKYENGNVFINNSQYFEGVSEIIWNFYIGGYQPAQKYLKDRKGRQLNSDEIEQYQKIIKVLFETDKLMKEIDIK